MLELFQASRFFFILPGEEPTDEETACVDGEGIDQLVSTLTTASLTVVSCFVSDPTQIKLKRLFSKMRPDWDPDGKFMSSLSSKVSLQSLPRTIFVNRGWTIDHHINETHFFRQLNHPDNLRDICKVPRNVLCCQDALFDVSVALDLLFNQGVKGYEVKRKQEAASSCGDELEVVCKRNQYKGKLINVKWYILTKRASTLS